jgi:hypothetical protein
MTREELAYALVGPNRPMILGDLYAGAWAGTKWQGPQQGFRFDTEFLEYEF